MKEARKCDIARRILVIGDAGRGKTTFANHIARRCDRTVLSLDDILWKKRYTQTEEREVAINRVKKVFEKEEWIVEGTTKYLARFGFDRAQMIYYFKHNNVCLQICHLIWRFINKRDCTICELYKLIIHTIYKRYRIGYERDEKTWDELLEQYQDKMIIVDSVNNVRELMIKIDQN
jgi:adenylate kinase family enzyme